MGKWILESIKLRHERINNAEQFGTNIRVKFRLRYITVPGHQSTFVETPQLVWYERIVMKTTQGPTQTYWEQTCNQYARNAGALTFKSWVQRYQAGYRWTARQVNTLPRGRVRLLNPVGLRAHPTLGDDGSGVLASNEATASRDYLGRWGGVLEIKVHDRPSFGLTSLTWDRKERYVFFTIGVNGGTSWRRARQHLIVDRTTTPPLMQENFTVHSERAWVMPTWPDVVNTTGFTQIDAPNDATELRDPGIWHGEYL
jgi:hypothetical protein